MGVHKTGCVSSLDLLLNYRRGWTGYHSFCHHHHLQLFVSVDPDVSCLLHLQLPDDHPPYASHHVVLFYHQGGSKGYDEFWGS